MNTFVPLTPDPHPDIGGRVKPMLHDRRLVCVLWRLKERIKQMNIALKLSAAIFAAAIFTAPAQASCRGTQACHGQVLKHSVAARHKTKVVTGGGQVVALIKQMAPRYGVPTWFALRIAKVESGYNPRARGSAGELGVFQLKCATAKGIGYHGNCSGLLNASTNVQYGLKHLSLAVKASHGNLKLAASKHNGGLGRKSLVPRYVAMVF
jgi:soluble lytic murein transglycosylase-like protein